MIEYFLKEAGLTDNEAKVYLALLKKQRLTYSQLSEITNINRTTCYAVVKQLIQQGIVKADLGQPIVQLIAQPPQSIVDKLGQEQARIIKKTELAKRAVLEMEKIVPRPNFIEPKITYIEERDIERHLYKKTDIWNKSTAPHDNTVWGFQDSLFEKQYRDYILWHWKRTSAEKIKVKLFSDDPKYSDVFSILPKERILRYWPKIIDLTASIWIWGDYIIILSIQEKPSYLLEIKEPLLAGNLRKFFQIMWQTTENIWGKDHT